MNLINIHEAKTNLSKIIAQVQGGKSVIIGKSNNPVAVISKYEVKAPKRQPGKLKGKLSITKDFTKTSKQIEKLFYEK